MGGISVDGGGHGARRSLDSEINMIPMIDLLMVTISFLLITAVWSHMSRINADAQVPGPERTLPTTITAPEKQLHVEVRGRDSFVLTWKLGSVVVSSQTFPRHEVVSHEGETRVVRFPDLASEVASEWSRMGEHRGASDTKLDHVVLHTDSDTPYADIIGAMDAVSQVHRPLERGQKVESVSAFETTFAVN